ncbi:MAG: electron transport complex subunit RsxE [Pseudomonadota bacterium]
MSTHGRLAAGLWRDNPGLVQWLGLCPLLAVSGTAVNALGLGIATLALLCASAVLVSVARHTLADEIHLPIIVLMIASLVTCTELLFMAYAPALERSLGVFIPLIAANSMVIASATQVSARRSVASSLRHAAGTGLGFALLLLALGVVRELLGEGTVFANLHLLTGSAPFSGLRVADSGWILAVLPPGAFFILGLALAVKHRLDRRWRA